MSFGDKGIVMHTGVGLIPSFGDAGVFSSNFGHRRAIVGASDVIAVDGGLVVVGALGNFRAETSRLLVIRLLL